MFQSHWRQRREALQAKSLAFLLSALLSMVYERIMEANPCQPFLMYNFTPCYGYAVKTALKDSVLKHTSFHPFHSICSEDTKSGFDCYPQNTRTNSTTCNIPIVRCCSKSWICLFGFLSSLVLKWRNAVLSIVFVLLFYVLQWWFIIHKLWNVNSLPWLFIELTFHFW